ncbi:MAG: PrsW family intramembrane metalloprotease [Candidatus Taylorbacteria bacterium]|nr:PrsW family intramembrane metalloprotease [Candidatus Taylorbacteria bacterium]
MAWNLSKLTPESLFYLILGGIVPAVLWLFFWLREDRLRPEPKRLIILTFVLGMVSAVVAAKLNQGLGQIFGQIFDVTPVISAPSNSELLLKQNFVLGLALVVLSALVEEVTKLGAAYFGGLRAKQADEPIDSVIYMITAALGFAALENATYLTTTFLHGDQTALLIALGNMRFIGPTLLHVLTSGTLGIFLAYAFYRRRAYKAADLALGVILATALHTFFNLFIMSNEGKQIKVFLAFVSVWVGIILLILFFERVKKIKPKPN